MTRQPCVLLLIPHLGGGGAEQVTLLLARKLGQAHYRMHLGLVTQSQVDDTYRIPATTQVHALGARRVRGSALRLLRLVWQTRPDIIVSNMAHLNFLVLLLQPFFPKRTRLLVRQNGTVSAMLHANKTSRTTKWLYRALYGRAKQVICQTDAMAEDLERIAPRVRGKTSVLANPVDLDTLRTVVKNSQSHWTGDGPHLLAVGRLATEKGFDLLLGALTEVKKEFPAADLAIAGAGSQMDSLQRLCHSLDLNRQVRFLGAVPAPAEYFCGATAFVAPSRHEGMPNALLEAAAAGLPIVATPASAGMVRLLSGKEGVWLAESTSADALAAALKQALHALEPGQRFPHPWIEAFRVDRAVAAYERLIDETLEAAR